MATKRGGERGRKQLHGSVFCLTLVQKMRLIYLFGVHVWRLQHYSAANGLW